MKTISFNNADTVQKLNAKSDSLKEGNKYLVDNFIEYLNKKIDFADKNLKVLLSQKINKIWKDYLQDQQKTSDLIDIIESLEKGVQNILRVFDDKISIKMTNLGQKLKNQT